MYIPLLGTRASNGTWTGVTAANNPPSDPFHGVPIHKKYLNAFDNGLYDFDDNRDPVSLLVWSEAGSGDMSVTIRLWGYSSVSGKWHPLGTGDGATKGVVNGGLPIGETGNNTIRHSEVVMGIAAFESIYAEITSISGTATAVCVALVKRGSK